MQKMPAGTSDMVADGAAARLFRNAAKRRFNCDTTRPKRPKANAEPSARNGPRRRRARRNHAASRRPNSVSPRDDCERDHRLDAIGMRLGPLRNEATVRHSGNSSSGAARLRDIFRADAFIAGLGVRAGAIFAIRIRCLLGGFAPTDVFQFAEQREVIGTEMRQPAQFA